MGFKMKGSAFKLGNVATKSVLKQKSPLEQDKTKFGYHDEEGNVIADATKDIVPAETGVGSYTEKRDDSGSDRATYQKKVSDVVRQTAKTNWKKEDRILKNKLRNLERSKKRKKRMDNLKDAFRSNRKVVHSIDSTTGKFKTQRW